MVVLCVASICLSVCLSLSQSICLFSASSHHSLYIMVQVNFCGWNSTLPPRGVLVHIPSFFHIETNELERGQGKKNNQPNQNNITFASPSSPLPPPPRHSFSAGWEFVGSVVVWIIKCLIFKCWNILPNQLVGNFLVLVKGAYWLHRCGSSGSWSLRVLTDGYSPCVEPRTEGAWARRDPGMSFPEGLRPTDFGIVCLLLLITAKPCGVFTVHQALDWVLSNTNSFNTYLTCRWRHRNPQWGAGFSLGWLTWILH